METEEWRNIKGWEGYYQVSSIGRVMTLSRLVDSGRNWRIVKERILLPETKKDGYKRVRLSRPSEIKSHPYQERVYVHRIVALTFPDICGVPTEEKNEIDHINKNRGDNRAENLHWVTKLENIRLRDKKNII